MSCRVPAWVAAIAVLAASVVVVWLPMRRPDEAGRPEHDPAQADGDPSHEASADDARRLRAARPGDPVVAALGDLGDDERQGSLLVRVIDEEGEPVPEALVRAARLRGRAFDARQSAERDPAGSWPAAWDASGRTAADGRIALTLTAGRSWIVHASGPGAADAEVADPENMSLVVLQLREAELRTVLVRSSTGSPIEGAELFAVAARGLGPATERFVTGPDGRAELRVAGSGALVARAAGFIEKSVPESADGTEIVLDPILSIGGVVEDTDGAPLPGAVVSGAGVTAASDEHGRFALRGLRLSRGPGPVSVRVVADGRLPWSGEAWPAIDDMQIVLRAGGLVRGRVVLEDGGGAPDVDVHAHAGDDRTSTRVTTDAAGDFAIRLAPGNWSLVCSARVPDEAEGLPDLHAAGTVRVEEGGEASVQLRLVRPVHSWVCVRVVLPDGTVARKDGRGGELPWMEVELAPTASQGGDATRFDEWSDAPRRPGVLTRTTVRSRPAEGVIVQRVARPPGTSFTVSVTIDPQGTDGLDLCKFAGFATVVSSSSPDATPFDLRLPEPKAAKVRLRVRNEGEAGAGATAAEITFQGPWTHRTVRAAVRDGEAVEVKCSEDEDIWGRVELAGRAVQDFRFDAPHRTGSVYDIVLPVLASVRGRVVDPTGAPVGGAEVCVRSEARSWTFVESSEAGSGKFRIAEAAAGPGWIEVTHRLDRRSLPQPKTTLRVQLVPGTEFDAGDLVLGDSVVAGDDEEPPGPLRPVTGRVLDASGRPVAAVAVHAGTAVPLVVGAARWTAISGPDGRYRVDVGSARPVLVAFERPGYGTEVVRLPAAPDGAGAPGAHPLDVTLGPGGDVRLVPDSAAPPSSSVPTDAGWPMLFGPPRLVVRGSGAGVLWVPRTGRDSDRSVTGIPAGTRAVLVLDGGRRIERTIVVRAGEVADLQY